MTFIRDLDELPDTFQAGALTIGNFDGVHLGHAALVKELVSAAQAVAGPAVVFTFDPHPVTVLRPELAPVPLVWMERKAELLRQLGVDLVVAYPTDKQFLKLSPEAFFEKVVRGRLNTRTMIEGANFCFGHDRQGTIDTLREHCELAQIGLRVVESVSLADDMISSSRIRKLVQAGEVALAGQLLARPYRVRGIVERGAARGAAIGFPTANLAAIESLIPGFGVYAGRTHWEGRDWPAAIHVGSNPTFEENEVKFEVHLVGFKGDLYGQTLEVDIMERIREVQTFDSKESLQEQLRQDVQQTVHLQTK